MIIYIYKTVVQLGDGTPPKYKVQRSNPGSKEKQALRPDHMPTRTEAGEKILLITIFIGALIFVNIPIIIEIYRFGLKNEFITFEVVISKGTVK